MQAIALSEGWDKPQARELFDQAAAFEPTYYNFYREHANYLLPKWYGEEGETQAFAEEVSSRLTPPDASIIYFEIASLLACQCDKERDSLAGMSWPRVKQGFQDLSLTYGTSNLKLNRFAYMSFIANDQLSGRNVFPRSATIGAAESGVAPRILQPPAPGLLPNAFRPCRVRIFPATEVRSGATLTPNSKVLALLFSIPW